MRTFREDIKFLKEIIEAPLFISNKGVYNYTSKFSIFPKMGIIDEDIEILATIANATKNYQEISFFKDLNLLLNKLNKGNKQKDCVGFEGFF